jgi:Flp pilus assembly protein TadD
MASADRPESWLNLGVIHAGRGELDDAETAYRKAIEIEPRIPMAYLNLADLYRQKGDDAAGIQLLQEAQLRQPNSPDLHYGMGLALVRQRRYDEALVELRTAAELSENDPQYSYVYAVALHSTGSSPAALKVLEQALETTPTDRSLLTALLTISLEAGDPERAQRAAARLEELWLAHPEVEGLLRQVAPALQSGG